MSSPEDFTAGPVIRDRRRIDPETGQVKDADQPGPESSRAADAAGPGPVQGEPEAGERRQGKHAARPGSSPNPDEAASALSQLAERTADLQRLQAEYANYRKRVERDRVAVREQALANVLGEFLPVLDDIGRAREHGELSGGFKSIAEGFEAAAVKLGLASYGEKGDRFDPVVHEALMHEYSNEVSEPTCVQILQPGYKIGDRILRPARVAVAEPGGGADAPDHNDDAQGEDGESPEQAPAGSDG